VIIPAVLLLVAMGAVLGGLPGLLVGWVTSQFVQGAAPWITGIATGLPIFLVVVIIPAAFLGGLVEVFKSSAWTLAFREARRLNEQSLVVSQ
jgi:tetrahydromethanopterin S-methyltransferase subunit D